MCLVLLQVKSGDGFVFVHEKGHMHIVSHKSDVISEFPSVALEAQCGQLQFADDPEVFAYAVACVPEGYLQIAIIDDGCGYNLKMYDRKVWNGFGFGDMFVADARQPVIGRHE